MTSKTTDSTITTRNVAEMRAVWVSKLDDGSICWVQDLRVPYTLIKDSGATPSGLEIVQPDSGAPSAGAPDARWFRGASIAGSQSWGEQSTWYINGDDGNDENDGATPATALLTLNEFARRVHGIELVGNTVVIISGTSVEASAQLNIDVNGTLIFQGTKEEIRTGTLTAVQVWDDTAGQSGFIEDTGFPNWATSVGRQIELTAGPNMGSKAWVADDLGAQRALFSPFANEGLFDNVDPQVGNGYTVYQFTILSGELVINLERGGIQFRELQIDTPGGFDIDVRVNDGPLVEFYDCILGGTPLLGSSVLSGSFQELWNCRVAAGLLTMQVGQTFMDGGLYECLTRVTPSGLCEVGLQTLFFGPSARIDVQFGGWMRVLFSGYWVAFEGDPTIPVTVEGGISTAAAIWGTAAAAAPAAFRVRNGGRIDYTLAEPLAILGAVSDTIIGGTVTAYGGLPFFNAANGCAVVEITV